jgi:Domain of unknown function (DUF4440)
MKNIQSRRVAAKTSRIAGIAALVLFCTVLSQRSNAQFKAPDQPLYDSIVHEDSVFFGAYNTCIVHLREYADFYADNLEFYHDKGGVMFSKADVVEATRKNVCGHTTRTLVPGSLEVYPIANYGAIEIGFHSFANSQDSSNTPHLPGRFVIIWHHTNGKWLITRVISLHG